MIEDTNGEEVLEAGMALIGFWLDLFEEGDNEEVNIDIALEAAKVLVCGYPNVQHTDIMSCYHEVDRVRTLWVNTGNIVGNEQQAVLIFEAYLRGYVLTFEAFQKLLIFDCYCMNSMDLNVEDFLFGKRNPRKMIENSGKPERRAPLLNLYKSEIRNAISHANTSIVKKDGTYYVILRDADSYNRSVKQTILSLEEFTDKFHSAGEIMFGSIRLFFYLYGYLQNKYLSIFKAKLGKCIEENEALGYVVKAIQQRSM